MNSNISSFVLGIILSFVISSIINKNKIQIIYF